MRLRQAESGSAQLDAVLEQTRRKLCDNQAAHAEPFAMRWFSGVAPEDLADWSVDDLYGAVVSHWLFACKHRGGTRLRVYNPKLEEHGWESTHTVVEIVNDDMPFLVDSITTEVNRQGMTLHLIIHPVMRIRRDESGQYLGLADDGGGEGRYESMIHLEVDRRTEAKDLDALRDGLQRVLEDVRVAVEDLPAMQQRVVDIANGIEQRRPPLPDEEISETIAFLRWLLDDNIVLLGCRDYELVRTDGENELRIFPGSGLGVLRERPGAELASRSFARLPAHLKATLPNLPVLLTVTKSNTRSTVHRAGFIDRFSVKVFDDKGRAYAERCIIGLLGSTAYSASPRSIPFLRRKVDTVIKRAGLLPKSRAGKALETILECYPRDELFQIFVDELYLQAMGILRLGERQRTRLFVRTDPFARFVSCLIYMPRERYNTDQRLRMQAVLMEAFNGATSDFDVQFSESALARVLIIVRTRDSTIPPFNVRELEERLVRATRRIVEDTETRLIKYRLPVKKVAHPARERRWVAVNAGHALPTQRAVAQLVRQTLVRPHPTDAKRIVDAMPAWVQQQRASSPQTLMFDIGGDMEPEELLRYVVEVQPQPVEVPAAAPGPDFDARKTYTVIGLFPSGAIRTVGTLDVGSNGVGRIRPFSYLSLIDPDDQSLDPETAREISSKVDLVAVEVL